MLESKVAVALMKVPVNTYTAQKMRDIITPLRCLRRTDWNKVHTLLVQLSNYLKESGEYDPLQDVLSDIVRSGILERSPIPSRT